MKKQMKQEKKMEEQKVKVKADREQKDNKKGRVTEMRIFFFFLQKRNKRLQKENKIKVGEKENNEIWSETSKTIKGRTHDMTY